MTPEGNFVRMDYVPEGHYLVEEPPEPPKPEVAVIDQTEAAVKQKPKAKFDIE